MTWLVFLLLLGVVAQRGLGAGILEFNYRQLILLFTIVMAICWGGYQVPYVQMACWRTGARSQVWLRADVGHLVVNLACGNGVLLSTEFYALAQCSGVVRGICVYVDGLCASRCCAVRLVVRCDLRLV